MHAGSVVFVLPPNAHDVHAALPGSVAQIDVPRGGSRGIQLHPGDEIHLGDARVLFEQV